MTCLNMRSHFVAELLEREIGKPVVTSTTATFWHALRLAGISDSIETLRARYDAEPGTVYLFRPDGYVAARFRHPTREAIEAALKRASGNS